MKRAVVTKLALSAIVFAIFAGGGAQAADSVKAQLREIANGEHRSAENKTRNNDRHPVETLTFFGIEPDMTVVELWPFGGWYTEILAPFLKAEGKLYTALIDSETTPGLDRYNKAYYERIEKDPEIFSEAETRTLTPDGRENIAPAGTADMVLTFRNIHNWTVAGVQKGVFQQAYRALKPGGILGVVEHRAKDPNQKPDERGEGYVGEQYTIDLVESVGFELVARSDVNNNPKDTKDYPRSVWTLPPNFAMGDKNREKYEAIGESDRFTLKFRKPE